MTPARLLLPIVAVLVAAGCASAPPAAAPAASPAPAAPAVPAAASPAPAAARTVAVAWKGGTASGDTGTVAVPVDTPVRIVVTSDVAEEIHHHGYDKEAQIPAGGTATLSFTADIPGEFELELHGSGDKLATLQVR